MKSHGRLHTLSDALLHPSNRVLGILALVLVLSLAWLGGGPWSPFALDRANRRLAQGDVLGAIRVCQRIERFNPSPGLRSEARFRVAFLQTTLTNEPQKAVSSLWALLGELPLDSPQRPEALALLAGTLGTRLKRPLRAARLFEEAAIAAEDDERQSAWLLSAAQAWEDAGEQEKAATIRARIAVSQDPRAAEAWLALGRSHLGSGEVERAYQDYQYALGRSVDPSVKKLARLGIGLCLDRMGSLDAAALEIEEEGSGSGI